MKGWHFVQVMLDCENRVAAVSITFFLTYLWIKQRIINNFFVLLCDTKYYFKNRLKLITQQGRISCSRQNRVIIDWTVGVINNKHSEAIQKTFTRKLYRGYYNMLKEGCEHTEMFIISLVFQVCITQCLPSSLWISPLWFGCPNKLITMAVVQRCISNKVWIFTLLVESLNSPVKHSCQRWGEKISLGKEQRLFLGEYIHIARKYVINGTYLFRY